MGSCKAILPFVNFRFLQALYLYFNLRPPAYYVFTLPQNCSRECSKTVQKAFTREHYFPTFISFLSFKQPQKPA
jgi:hypothetical protein